MAERPGPDAGTMTESRDRPPFRAEHVGSFVRPPRLLEAARAHKADALDLRDFRAIQDACIRDIVAFQEGLGLKPISDGEFRRRGWSAGFIDAVEGFGLRPEGAAGFKTEAGDLGLAASPYAKARIRRRRRIVADDYPASWAWRGYNEQLGVAALLLGGERYRPLFASHYVVGRMDGAQCQSPLQAD